MYTKKKKNEFTLFDLLGFTAVEVDEGELGKITAIDEYPQQIIATVSYKGIEVLFPLNEEIIQSIVKNKREQYVHEIRKRKTNDFLNAKRFKYTENKEQVENINDPTKVIIAKITISDYSHRRLIFEI